MTQSAVATRDVDRSVLALADAPWTIQISNLITTPDELAGIIALTGEERLSMEKAAAIFPMSITPYYASLMDPQDRNCPIRKQAVPSADELRMSEADIEDPLHEDEDSPVPGLTHRYPDRVLLLVTEKCAMFCRHCTRKRKVGDNSGRCSTDMLDRGLEYIREHKAIRDVLISGGDPLMLSDQRLEEILSRLRAIEHVEVIRIGTRVPVVLPQRITPQLVAVLKRFHPLWINTHFNHPMELTPQSSRALTDLADAGIPLGNQTVLLRNVNDCPAIIKKLCQMLVKNRVRPYYLYQCDLSRGIEHFRTSISRGTEIMEMMIGHTSGFAVPRYVVDAPGGGGKIPVQPNYLLSSGTGKTILRNYEGVICVYAETRHRERRNCENCKEACAQMEKGFTPVGLGKLFSKDYEDVSIIPEGNVRLRRLKKYRLKNGGGNKLESDIR